MATKKSTATTDTDKYQKLFDIVPYMIPSQFELENFNATTSSIGFPRRVIEVVNKIRELSSANLATTEYEKNNNQANIDALKEWLDNYKIDNLCDLVSKWEEKELNFWIDKLGKTSAIEIITAGQISKDTMEKMTMLPEEGYVKATQLCVKLANAIKQATIKAEEDIGIRANAPEKEVSPDPQPIEKRGIKLKSNL